MMRFAAAAAALSLAACASQDRAALTEFEPLEAGAFRYEATSGPAYPLDSPTAEAERIRWLERYLADNALCPDGYQITERKVVLTDQVLFGDIHRIYYSGACM